MDDDLILAVGNRGRGKGEFTNPQVFNGDDHDDTMTMTQ